MKILLVLLGGSLGALSRYGVSLLAVKLFGVKFPWGTLIVNLSGCFLIGLAFAWGERGFGIMNPSVRLFFMTGYLGALTTFSTFGLETSNCPAGGEIPGGGGQYSGQQCYRYRFGFFGYGGGPTAIRRGNLCNPII